MKERPEALKLKKAKKAAKNVTAELLKENEGKIYFYFHYIQPFSKAIIYRSVGWYPGKDPERDP